MVSWRWILPICLCALASAVRADEITAERVATLSSSEKSVWLEYLNQSNQFAQIDAEALSAEVKAAGLDRAIKAPSGGDFKLSHKPGDDWYATPEAAELAKVILSFQAPCGGWSKHISYGQGPRQPGMQWTSQSEPGKKPHYQATIDNRSTTEQLLYISSISHPAVVEQCREGFRRGLRYLLFAQFPSGGWPQVYPLEGGYHDNITYNDDAMVHVLEVLLQIEEDSQRFAFLDPAERQRASEALRRGVQCLIKSQVLRHGTRTAWCAQHDALTLEPAAARSLEPKSLSGSESAHILQFLMRLDRPDAETVETIETGLKWLDEVKLTGWEKVKVDGKTTYQRTSESKEIYWARFYNLETNRPIFPGRDGKIYSSFEELAANNRLGYDYLSTQPGSILKNGQKKWRATLKVK